MKLTRQTRQVFAAALLMVVVTGLPFVKADTVPGGSSVGSGIASILYAVFTDPPNSVFFIYPDTVAGRLRCTASMATMSDWVGGSMIYAQSTNPQLEVRDDNPAYTSTVANHCAPLMTNSALLLFGGPSVNNFVNYYEQVVKITPVYFSSDGVNDYFIKRSDGSIIASLPRNQVPGSKDYFVMEVFNDSNGNTVYVFYGFSYKGSTAAARELIFLRQVGALSIHTSQWNVYSWQNTNGNGMVNDPSIDTYTLIASG